MLRYYSYFALFLVLRILVLFITPILPLFARPQLGPTDNSNATAVEPRLPKYLSWFQTPDNSLYGDTGWRTIHCLNYASYWGMTKWLYRNALYGFSWTVLAWELPPDTQFTLEHSGDGLAVDKSLGRSGWYKITADSGCFSYRWVLVKGGWLFSFENGWLLDIYIKDPEKLKTEPKALFQVGLKFPKRIKNR